MQNLSGETASVLLISFCFWRTEGDSNPESVPERPRPLVERESVQATMSQPSKIEWTDSTWNPVRGCDEVSPGCANCYARVFAERFRGVPGNAYEQGFDLRLVPHKLPEPLRLKKPRMIFVNSMSDLFHEGVPDDYVIDVVRVMQIANHHTYQVLTKRSERMRDMLNSQLQFAADEKHIWWGVSVENRKHGLPRINHLRAAHVKARFLSVEPLLEDIGTLDLRGIHWVIVGGESGHRARPMKREWATSIRDQCWKAKVPFFFKQWGELKNNPDPKDPTATRNCGDALGGRLLDDQTHHEFPFPLRNYRLHITPHDVRLAMIEQLAEKYKLDGAA